MTICRSPLLSIRLTGDHKLWKSRLSPKPDGSTFVDTLRQERDGSGLRTITVSFVISKADTNIHRLPLSCDAQHLALEQKVQGL